MLDANGNVSANVSDIVKRVVGSGSAELKGRVLYDTYVNVIREQLGQTIFNIMSCKEKMVGVAIQQACPKPQENIEVKKKFNDKSTNRKETVPQVLRQKAHEPANVVVRKEDNIGNDTSHPVNLRMSDDLWSGLRFVDFEGPPFATRRINIQSLYPEGRWWEENKYFKTFVYTGAIVGEPAEIYYIFGG